MALMMKVQMEDSRKELNIVIWNENDADEVKTVENPIVNLKIPLKPLNKEIAVDENIWEGFAVKKTPSKDSNEVHGLSDISNKRNSAGDGADDNERMESETVQNMNFLSTKSACSSFVEDKENNSSPNSLIDSMLDYENEDEDLSFAGYLEYIKKKSEAFEKMEHELCVPQNTKETNGFSECVQSQTEEDESSLHVIPPMKKKATDAMSVASDDYTLTIEDDSTERDDERKNVGNSNGLSPKKESSPARCQSCDKVFAKKTSRRQHMIAAHELKFACPICGIMFSVRKQLLQHLRVHGLKNPSSPRAPPPYPCSQCSRKYKCQKALKEHLKSHAPIQSRFFWRVSKMNVSLPRITKMNAVALGVPECKSSSN